MMLVADFFGSLQGAGLLILPLAGGVLLAFGVYNAVFDLRRDERKKVLGRLRGADGKREKAGASGGDYDDFRRHTKEATGMLARLFSRLSFTASFQRTLEQANLNWNAAQTLVNLTAVAACILAVLVVIQLPPLASIGAAAAVFILPLLYLFSMKKARMKKLVNQLPDVFELLGQALRAGHSLASGMQVVAKELPDPAGTEFGRVFHEQNLGLKIEDALKNMADRVDLLDVRFFVTAVLIQRQVGGDLAEVLDKIGAVIRDRIKLFGTVQALTAEGRLSGYVLLALPTLVFGAMMQVNREYAMLLFTDPLGKMLLTASIVMQLMGWAMIKKIVNIKV